MTDLTRRNLLASAIALPLVGEVIDPHSMRILDEAPSSLHARFRTRVALLRRATAEYVAAFAAWRAVSPTGWPSGPVPASYAPPGMLVRGNRPHFYYYYVSDEVYWHWYVDTNGFYRLAVTTIARADAVEDPTLTERDRAACSLTQEKASALESAKYAVVETAREILADVIDSTHVLVVDGKALIFARTVGTGWRLANKDLSDMTVIR